MSAPVKHTCPDIDAVINAIDAAISEANKGREIVDSNSPAEDCFREILSELRPLEKQLEQLRSDNAALRKWGEELEEKVDELEREAVIVFIDPSANGKDGFAEGIRQRSNYFL